MPRDWIKNEHEIYKERKAEWEAEERRMEGDESILRELVRFDWEKRQISAEELTARERDAIAQQQSGQHYLQRQTQAIYVNFPDEVQGNLVGHLMRKRPTPGQGLDFGTLGQVRRERERAGVPSKAEQLYYNVDGVGVDGSQWDNWWSGVQRRAGGTGHRWLFTEGPAPLPQNRRPNRAEELRGYRPYLIEYSPLEVPNWIYWRGTLQYAVLRLPWRKVSIDNSGRMVGNESRVAYWVMTCLGFSDVGREYAGGGWWVYDDNGDTIPEAGNGTWGGALAGEIPLWPHFAERSRKKFSRSPSFMLGQAAVAYMNIDSAAQFDGWDAAKSISYFLGVTPANYKVAIDKIGEGSQYVPVPPTYAEGAAAGTPIIPQVQDSASGSIVGETLTNRLKHIRETVTELSSMIASSTPDSSGASKVAGFEEAKSPRLALMASEMEQSQNIALNFLERRWSKETPTAVVNWPRDFALLPVLDSLEKLFGLERLTGYRSKTVGEEGMVSASKAAGLITDSVKEEAVRGEYRQAIEKKEQQEQEDRDLEKKRTAAMTDFGNGDRGSA